MKNWIKNRHVLEIGENRKLALELAEAAFESINTESVILNGVKLENNILSVQGKEFDLSKFKKIKVIGFGKASGEGALALEKVLGDRITEGAIVGLEKVECKNIESFIGTHPRPSETNVPAGKRIFEIINGGAEEDLVIVLVSGGGSSFLCYPESEYVQGAKLYDAFLKAGKTITEINTVRKHLSLLKGGGLAKLAYPATVIGLIFSDIPGNNFENVASGATYKDQSTVADAKRIIEENNLGEYELIETPKEDKYFEKVHNFVLVSNDIAVEMMARKGKELDLETKIISTELYDEDSNSLSKIFSAKEEGTAVLAAGEPKIEVANTGGKGGRNMHMALDAINLGLIDDDSVFISLASDGMDNSDAAAGVADKITIEKAKKLGLDPADYLKRFDSYNFFQKTGDIIITGPTGANVSDLMILVTKKNK